ncbi:LCP family protein [Patescibacteria group bacterium]
MKKIKKLLQNKNTKLLVLFFLSLSISFYMFKKNPTKILSPNGGKVLSDASPSAKIDVSSETEDNSLDVLLLGYGGAGHQGGYLADVIMLAHFDLENKILGLISIPRDSFYEGRKINNLLSISKGKLNADYIKSAVTSITGKKVDYFIGIDFAGFERTIGQDLGGLTVNVSETFEDSWYPTKGQELNPCGKTPEEIATLTSQLSGFALEKEFECRYKHIYYKKGPNHMEGGDALAYVRSRHSSSDFARSERQRAVLLAMKDKLFDLNALDRTSRFFKNLSVHVSTDLDLGIIDSLVPVLKNIPELESKSITLSTENVLQTSTGSSGQFILIPNSGWDSVKIYINQNLKTD